MFHSVLLVALFMVLERLESDKNYMVFIILLISREMRRGKKSDLFNIVSHLISLLKTSGGTRFVCCVFHLYNYMFSFLEADSSSMLLSFQMYALFHRETSG